MCTASPETVFESADPLPHWVRGGLLLAAAGILTVFAVAWWIDPYKGRGSAERMGTHRQLGLPPCTFLEVTDLPCPSCGLTTSFAFTVRGDLVNGARANWVGVLLVIGLALAVPWALASAYKGRPLWVQWPEQALVTVVLTTFVLLFVRWGVVVGLWCWAGKPAGP